MADNTVQIEARKWIDSLDGKWRLQILSKRQRLNLTTGERKDMPTRLRRFVEGMPWAFVSEGIRYLISKAPYRGLIFNGVRLDEEYRPTLTVWQRDDRETINTGAGKPDGTYTLIQDLIAVDEPDLYGATTSASCSEEVVTEWHWDEAEPMDLPAPEQGVTWAIQANRKEDGTFDYALIKRVALTQHTGETVVKDTVTEIVRADSWNNVYTDDEGRYVDNYGAPLDIPESHSADGVVCEVTRQINDDCTFRVSAQWTESKDATVRESCQKTQFEHEHSVGKVGQAEPLGEAPEASGGVVKKHEDQLQPDGRYSTVENTQTELPVEKARVHVTVGRRGKRVERTDRNQPEPAPTEGLDIGQSVVVEKTPGKLYNNTTVNFDLSEKQRVAESCEIDLFKHDHSETTAGVDEIPGIDEHVEGSGQNGDVKTRRTEMDDEGSVSQTNAVHHEKEVLKYRETWRVGLRGVHHSVTDMQTSPSNVPVPPAYSKENIGKSVSVEKTPGGLVNITVEDTERETPLDAGAGCGKTVFEHQDTTITNDPDGGFSGHVPDAGGGKYYDSQSRLNEDGTSTITETEHKELPVLESEVEIRKTAKAIYRTITDRNVADSASEPAGIGTSRHKTNPGGTHDVTRTDITILNVPDRAHCAQNVFEHVHDDVAVTRGDRADSSDTPAPGGGRYYSKDSQVDEYGVVTTVLRATNEIAVPVSSWEKRKTLTGVVETIVSRNVPDGSVEVSKVGDDVRVEMTPGGRYNRTEVHVSREPVGEIGIQCEDTAFEHRHGTTSNNPSRQHDEATEHGEGGRHGALVARQTEVGTWDETVTTTAEKTSKWYGRRKTLNGVQEITYFRNDPDDHRGEVSEVGDSSEAQLTPGGYYTGRLVKMSREPVGEIGVQCDRTVFEHRHGTVTNKIDGVRDEALEPGGGHYGSLAARQTEVGTWDETWTTVDELRQEWRSALRKTARATYKTTTYRHEGHNHEGDVDRAGDSMQATMTPGGLYDVQVTELDSVNPGKIVFDCSDTYFDHSDTTTGVEGLDYMPREHCQQTVETNTNHVYRKVERQNDDGSWDVVDSDKRGKPRDEEYRYRSRNKTVIRWDFWNQSKEWVDDLRELINRDFIPGELNRYRQNDFRYTPNEKGTFDGSLVSTERPTNSPRDKTADIVNRGWHLAYVQESVEWMTSSGGWDVVSGGDCLSWRLRRDAYCEGLWADYERAVRHLNEAIGVLVTRYFMRVTSQNVVPFTSLSGRRLWKVTVTADGRGVSIDGKGAAVVTPWRRTTTDEALGVTLTVKDIEELDPDYEEVDRDSL